MFLLHTFGRHYGFPGSAEEFAGLCHLEKEFTQVKRGMEID